MHKKFHYSNRTFIPFANYFGAPEKAGPGVIPELIWGSVITNDNPIRHLWPTMFDAMEEQAEEGDQDML